MNNKLFNILIIITLLFVLIRSCFKTIEKDSSIDNIDFSYIDSLEAIIEGNQNKTDTIYKYIDRTKIKIIEVSLLNDSIESDLDQFKIKKDTLNILMFQDSLINGLKSEVNFYSELSKYSDSILMIQNNDLETMNLSNQLIKKQLQIKEKDNKKLIKKNKVKNKIIKGSVLTNIALITFLILNK